MRRLTAGWVTPIRPAAPVTLPDSITARNASTWRKLIRSTAGSSITSRYEYGFVMHLTISVRLGRLYGRRRARRLGRGDNRDEDLKLSFGGGRPRRAQRRRDACVSAAEDLLRRGLWRLVRADHAHRGHSRVREEARRQRRG